MLNPHIGWVLVAIASKTWNNSPWHCVYFELRAGRTNDEYQRWAVEKCVLILLCWLTSKGQWEKPTSSHSVIDKNRTCSVVLPVISSPTANQKKHWPRTTQTPSQRHDQTPRLIQRDGFKHHCPALEGSTASANNRWYRKDGDKHLIQAHSALA